MRKLRIWFTAWLLLQIAMLVTFVTFHSLTFDTAASFYNVTIEFIFPVSALICIWLVDAANAKELSRPTVRDRVIWLIVGVYCAWTIVSLVLHTILVLARFKVIPADTEKNTAAKAILGQTMAPSGVMPIVSLCLESALAFVNGAGFPFGYKVAKLIKPRDASYQGFA